MGQVLHSCAKTTEAVCREIQNSKESLMRIAKRDYVTSMSDVAIHGRDK
jgi:hypothetical protein